LICGGKLPKPVEHDCDYNHYRFCIKTGGAIPFDLQINHTDIYNFIRVLRALERDKDQDKNKKLVNRRV